MMTERTEKLRWLLTISLFLGAFLVVLSCNDDGVEPEDPVKITDPLSFFPITEGNLWSYNNGVVIREIDGDTTINGITCSRLLRGGETAEALTIDAGGFYQHLLDGAIWFDPPLPIPFSLEKDEPYEVFSIGRELGEDTTAIGSFSGTLTFKGYVSRTVVDHDYDSLVYLDYKMTIYNFADSVSLQTNFDEFYARNIGLVLSRDIESNGAATDALNLDSARINGVWQPTE
jgi:hypothetical protein